MNPKHTLLAIAVTSIALAGCDQAPSKDEELHYLDQQAGAEVRKQTQDEQTDLKQTLTELQSKDPYVKDAYYGVDEKGDKVLHVVREEANGQASDMIWPLIGGAATGFALAKLMNSYGGYGGYSNLSQPVGRTYYQNTEDERRKRRNVVVSGYNSYLMNNARSTIRMQPNYKTTMAKAVVSSRSSGIFSGGTGSRSSGYSLGG